MRTSSQPASRWKIFGLAFATMLAPMLLWALASPLGSIPDEPSHAIRAAAVVRGQFITEAWAKDPSMARSDVPRYVAEMKNFTCYAFRPTVTPACERPATGDQNAIVTTGNTATNNSPFYYAIVGLPTLLLDGTVALYAMRFVNAVLCAAALSAMFMQLTMLARSRWTVAGAVIAVTPMVLFLSGSINPNAIEAASAGALFATLAGLVRAPSIARVLWERALIVVLSVLFLVNTRSISLLWLLLVFAAALALADRGVLRSLLRKPAAWIALGGSAVISIAALLWFAHPPALVQIPLAGAGTSAVAAFTSMLVRTFDFADAYVGMFGWEDTPSPAFSLIVWSAAIVALIVVAFVWGSGRARWVVAGFGLTMVIVPPITQAIIAPHIGYIWQGRYMLAMLLCLLVACGMAIDNSFEERPLLGRGRVALITGISLLAVGQVLSFVWTLRRYVVGITGSVDSMVTHPAWQPPLGWILLGVLLALWAILASAVVFRSANGGSTPEKFEIMANWSRTTH